jgi:hypothetical protein
MVATTALSHFPKATDRLFQSHKRAHNPFFLLVRAKPFYKRIVFGAVVTLIHVINKAFESYW